MSIDLNAFGPWRDAVCDECGTLQLVVGTPEGPKCCKACWLDVPTPGSRQQAAAPHANALFDATPYDERRGGA